MQLLPGGNMADLLASHKSDQDRRGTCVVTTACSGPHCPVKLP